VSKRSRTSTQQDGGQRGHRQCRKAKNTLNLDPKSRKGTWIEGTIATRQSSQQPSEEKKEKTENEERAA